MLDSGAVRWLNSTYQVQDISLWDPSPSSSPWWPTWWIVEVSSLLTVINYQLISAGCQPSPAPPLLIRVSYEILSSQINLIAINVVLDHLEPSLNTHGVDTIKAIVPPYWLRSRDQAAVKRWLNLNSSHDTLGELGRDNIHTTVPAVLRILSPQYLSDLFSICTSLSLDYLPLPWVFSEPCEDCVDHVKRVR